MTELEHRPDFEIETMREQLEVILATESEVMLPGDSLHWYNNFLCGIVTRKDYFLTALRFMRPDFLQYEIYSFAYKYYSEAYRKNGRHPSMSDIKEMALEDADLDEKERYNLELVIEMSIRESGGSITEEQFEIALDRIIESKKATMFDSKVLMAAKQKKEGNLNNADKILENYLSEFRHLENRDMPIEVSKGIWELSEECGHASYSYASGFDRVDRVTGGGFRGETWVVGGYTGDGKTALTKEIIFKNILRREQVFWCSLEMNNREMMALFATRTAQDMGFSNLTLNKIRRKNFDNDIEREQFEKVMVEMKKFDNLLLYNPSGRFTMRDLEVEIDRIQGKRDLDIVVVDYLELLDPVKSYSNYRIEVKETMRVAKRLANEKDIWLIIPHQVSREGRKQAIHRRPYPHYILSDLQESSGVEQNCVVMLWIYHDEFYRKEHRARMGVSKNRMGQTETVGWEIGADYSVCKFWEDGLTLVGQIELED